MSNKTSRRTFLRQATWAAAAAAGGFAGAWKPRSAGAIEPVTRQVAGPQYKSLAGEVAI